MTLLTELAQDFAAFSANRFEPLRGRSLLRQLWTCWKVFWDAEALPSVVRYRLSVWLRRHHVPFLPGLFDRWNRIAVSLSIGKPVQIGPGVYFPHGWVVIDGIVTIGAHCVISPWVTVGLSGKADERGEAILLGPTIGDGVFVGTGAKLLGPIKIGDGARIGANAVVLCDVPAGATAVGVPARIIEAGAAEDVSRGP